MISISLECGTSFDIEADKAVYCSGKKCLEVEGNDINAEGFKSVDEVLDVVDTIKQLIQLDNQ